MTEWLLLRLEAPLMSFGGVVVDEFGVTRDFPPRSLLAGLLGNAIGLHHGHCDELNRLQARLHYAVRQDVAGELVRDYQTVSLEQDHLKIDGWTTRGQVEERRGGAVATHIRYRYYLADAAYTVALALAPGEPRPNLQDLAAALAAPERPLFIGRKCCLPSTSILLGRVQADDPVGALLKCPLHHRSRPRNDRLPFWWMQEAAPARVGDPILLASDRDWRNQIHTGRRAVCRALLAVEANHD
jgi:CRISPR system Cascade subunit CasD